MLPAHPLLQTGPPHKVGVVEGEVFFAMTRQIINDQGRIRGHLERDELFSYAVEGKHYAFIYGFLGSP